MDLGRMPQSIAGHVWEVPEPNQMMVPEPCPDDKNSEEQNFWNQQKISDLDNRLEIVSKETKLQMAISDLKYVIDKSKEATTHSALIGERRSQILESELKHKRKDFDVEVDTFFQSPAEVSTNVLIKRLKRMKTFSMKRTMRKASYAHSQELLNEGVQLPASKNEVRGNVSTCKKWVVGTINVSKRFREYQMKALEKAKTEGLKYDDIYEILALSSIMVFHWPCPYPSFTIKEWEEIMSTNPYKIQESPLPQEILLRLREAYNNHFIGNDVFMNGGEMKLSRIVACSFNDLYNCIPDIAPQKMTEDEHCYKLLHPISCPIFSSSKKEYELTLNRANKNSTKRPDLSCVIEGDLMKTYFMNLRYDGLYSSWAFQTTKMVVDKASIPLADFSISHLVALEEHVERITKDFKYRKCRTGSTTPPEQISYMRDEPDSPQIKKLIGYNSLKRIEKNK
ncbi:hypothetical protein C1645_851987 [Glomus cerebriforme]|uniref:Uncharacterized protein n=1 Tax=Glomus cerebriforme TaxID=658196 RepID=A0A397SW14_9GLOM|nr:hypothetical protein C1645_851987 [Glomus cerebriforme]